MRNILLLALLAHSLSAQSSPEFRQSVSRALPPLEHSAAAFVAKRACVSCHHNILSILMLHLARDRGVTVDSAALDAVEAKTFRSLRGPSALDDAVLAVTLNDPTPDDSYLLMAAHAAGLAPDLTTAVYARRLVQWQRDGHWVTSDFRPPHSSSLFTATATAVRAISLYMPEELSAERDACILRARRWLSATRPASTEDGAFRLMGLVWADAGAHEIAAARRDLLAMRKPTGGWPELPGYSPDAYSTGQSLFALHEAGVSATDAVWRAGLSFLISTQALDGTWRVRTRMISPAEVSPAYFATGFPYQKDEFLSYAGSAWAVMALLAALPAEAPARALPAAAKDPAPLWVRTALFGTPQQLTALLDHGLDPNSKTAKGTTLLMMVAADAHKVRMLLARGADAEARAPSGQDALTIAAASRDTAPALRYLLDAGAEVDAPAALRMKNSPLLFAAMSGDLGNVKLLLAHGANPSGALAQAVTFGYPDIVRALIAAGAPAKLTESSGINLLHWAVITNHPAVIPALVAAGVPINAKDESGYTPLMYAATIDFGDTASLKALLKAGADPNLRNGDGRNALEQARHYQHANLDAALDHFTPAR
jgi:ankyrin repeat protein